MRRSQLCEDPLKKEEQMSERVNLMYSRDMKKVLALI